MGGQLEFRLKEPTRRIALSVSQLVRLVRETLELNLADYWVVGEVSNARLAPSNHLYFTLKDSRSSINVVMFSSAYRRLRFRVDDGMAVVVRGRVNLYEARGNLQFYAEEMEPRGLGALQAAYEQLKQKLAREGLFDAGHKKRLPYLPRTIGIVTALGGAALRDMIRVLTERFPNLHVIVRPATVQGPGAPAEIAAALADLNTDGRAEVIIAGRGGGSLEDLWAFNEEVVARAIFRSAIPVISAVGHEIDYTIADFVADRRAATPTAAAQLVTPVKAELRGRLYQLAARLGATVNANIITRRRQLSGLQIRLRHPGTVLRQLRQRLDVASEELNRAMLGRTKHERRQLRENSAQLRIPASIPREQRLAVNRLTLRLAQAMGGRATPCRIRVERVAARLSPSNLTVMLAGQRAALERMLERLEKTAGAAIELRRAQLLADSRRLDSLSPLRVLGRGYALVLKDDGRAVVDPAQVEPGEEVRIRIARGNLSARITGRRN